MNHVRRRPIAQAAEPEPPEPRRRLPREERERQIVAAAVRFFAEVGFEGQTRALAERLGVTQPLLYRYFPDKEKLIERVYEEVYLSRFKPEWETLIRDRGRPLVERLTAFYSDYARTIFTYEWVRIFMFAGLKDVNINARYLELVRSRILTPICQELRATAELPADTAPDPAEVEAAWGLHGGVFYLGIRQFIYHLPVPEDLDAVIARQVRTFIEGAPAVLRAESK